MFQFEQIADKFDDHLKGQLFWHKDFVNHFLPEIASVYMEKDSYVYDFGASTGNVEIALSDMIDERGVSFVPVEKCFEMSEKYKGNKGRLIIGDFLHAPIQEFSFATSILALCFVHPSKRINFIQKLKSKCKVGGAFVILEKMTNFDGYLGTALSRVTWKNKLEQGESIEQVVNKELSLSGVQYPLHESELEGFKLIWAYGNFRSYIYTNGF